MNSENTETMISAPTDTEDTYLPATMRTDRRSSAKQPATLKSEKSVTLKSENRTFDERSAKQSAALTSANQSDWETPDQLQQGSSRSGIPPPLSRNARSLFHIPTDDELMMNQTMMTLHQLSTVITVVYHR